MQQTFESLKNVQDAKAIKESEITEEALIKLIKITVFLVQKHWAHTYNYNKKNMYKTNKNYAHDYVPQLDKPFEDEHCFDLKIESG